MSNDYDRAARYGIKHAPVETRRWLFPRLPDGLRYRRWLDSQSAPRPMEPDRRCDTIMELHDEDGPWLAAIIELFTHPDSDALRRGGEYLWRFDGELRHGPHDEDHYNLFLVLFFLTTAPPRTQVQTQVPGMPEVFNGLSPRVLALAGEDALAHLAMIAQNPLMCWLLIWLPLMKGSQTKECAQRWRQLAGNDSRLLDMADLTLILARLTGCDDIYKKELEGIMLMVSPYAEEIRKDGQIKVRRTDTLEILNKRFPGKVPASVVKRVNAQSDLATLQEWLILAATTASPEEFEQDTK